MKRTIAASFVLLLLSSGALMAAKGPEIDLVDNKLSVNAENVPLGRLLQLVDLATGMKSKVPADLANRSISVKFSGLNMSDAVRKIFQGQPFDYVVVPGRGIIVTAASQVVATAEAVPAYNPPPSGQPIEQPFIQEFPQAPVAAVPPFQQQQQPQPPTVQTPFGPIANPRAQQQQGVNTFGAPPQNSLFPQQSNQPFVQQPGFQAVPVPNQNPLGAVSPFGTQSPPPQNQNIPNNGLFGGVPTFGTPAQQQPQR
jgi:hypothetical protein